MNATSPAGGYAALSHYGLLRAGGADARSFLQAQLTADLGELTAERSPLSAWCNAKGRVQAIFRLFTRDDDIYLRLPAELIPLTLPRLKMFVLRAKVALADISAEWHALGVWGDDAAVKLRDLLGQVPELVNQIMQGPELVTIRVRGAGPRFEIWGTSAAIASLRETLQQAGLRAGSEHEWRVLEMEAGLPELHTATREAFTPHMLNLDLLGAVSFGKGCYPGQEVVAKTQHRGLAKRRLFLADCASATPPSPGARVLTAEGSHAGDVVEALQVSSETCRLSAVLMLEHAASSALHLAESQLALKVYPPATPFP